MFCELCVLALMGGQEVYGKCAFNGRDRYFGCLSYCTSKTWKDILAKVYTKCEMLFDDSIIFKMLDIRFLHGRLLFVIAMPNCKPIDFNISNNISDPAQSH